MAIVLDLTAVPSFSVSDHRTLAQRGVKVDKPSRSLSPCVWRSQPETKTCCFTAFFWSWFAGNMTALEKLNEYFQPKIIFPFERHVFRRASQQPDESMDVSETRLRTFSKSQGLRLCLIFYSSKTSFSPYEWQLKDIFFVIKLCRGVKAVLRHLSTFLCTFPHIPTIFYWN